MNESSTVHIVGAGISGLICALELEKAGYAPVILERTNSVGGRVKSDFIDGRAYDHGFQVLLTQYPAAQKYLDYEPLHLHSFAPGALIQKGSRSYKIGDPLRNLAFLSASLFAPVGNLFDKLRILRLNRKLRNASVESIFQHPEVSTLQYLKDFGFSDGMIRDFFRPFFTGIFLEPDLSTSSRMFEFVFKMFGSGHAAIPAKGMQAIPDQLKSKLKKTEFRFSTGVKKVTDSEIFLEDGTSLPSDKTVIATDPTGLLADYQPLHSDWHSCTTLYFKSPNNGSSVKKLPLIVILPDQDALVNTFYYLKDLIHGPEAGTLISATVVKKHDLDDDTLAQKVRQELVQYTGRNGFELIKAYPIHHGLPALGNLQYHPSAETIRYSDHIFLAGDHLAYGSLNAAMDTGRLAAEAVMA
jgi:uncharacterized protein with NAD-binding domain and iron-sulfur cluster